MLPFWRVIRWNALIFDIGGWHIAPVTGLKPKGQSQNPAKPRWPRLQDRGAAETQTESDFWKYTMKRQQTQLTEITTEMPIMADSGMDVGFLWFDGKVMEAA
ncbi:MAG: hypothetical protein K6G91_10185 [Kiritimatiellae bacterium]|nr:hypothetical protein [Kiritimatiellia bacterium]